ncbi:MAG: hypothetical protein LUC83_02890 [Clostridiales bacterium]|nr:hypothetical protein [Clostridiales bacterium]
MAGEDRRIVSLDNPTIRAFAKNNFLTLLFFRKMGLDSICKDFSEDRQCNRIRYFWQRYHDRAG